MKSLLEKTDITRVLFSSKKGDIQFMVAVPATEEGPTSPLVRRAPFF